MDEPRMRPLLCPPGSTVRVIKELSSPKKGPEVPFEATVIRAPTTSIITLVYVVVPGYQYEYGPFMQSEVELVRADLSGRPFLDPR